MEYHIGDQIIHMSYGPGIITGIEEKRVADERGKYYVVQTGELTLWVPLDATEDRIRFPVARSEFHSLLALLSAAAEQLPDFHRDRQGILAERMRSRDLSDVCAVIRDLAGRAQSHPPNNNDREVMGAAQAWLLNEWEIVAGISRTEARTALERILADQSVEPGRL
jgi:RNA polymerase-interacting CarD/CdnL/TRCF family regulator